MPDQRPDPIAVIGGVLLVAACLAALILALVLHR